MLSVCALLESSATIDPALSWQAAAVIVTAIAAGAVVAWKFLDVL